MTPLPAVRGLKRVGTIGYNMDELNQQEKEPEVMRDAWKRAVGAPQLGLAGLLLLLSLACASASAPVTQEPPASTGTPVADGIVQTPGRRLLQRLPVHPKPRLKEPGKTKPRSVNDSKDTSESIPRSSGTGGDSQVASNPRDGDEKAAPIPRSGGTDVSPTG